MSTLPLEKLDQEKFKEHLKEVLQVDTISDFTSHPSAVNTTLQFEANKRKYIIKLMTTTPTSEWEKYRYNKVGKLFEQFATNSNIPTPQVIHVEDNEQLIGFRYIIISFIEGENLWHIWQNLTEKDIIPIIRELAQIVRAIHSIEYTFYGDLEEIDSATRYSDYKEKMLDQLKELVDKLLTRQTLPQELVLKAQEYFSEHLDMMNFPVTSTLLHNDIHQGNIIVKKNDQGVYKIQALIDWEWACADNPLEDIVYIDDSILQDQKISKIFYNEYYQGENENLDAFAIDIRLFNILWKLDDVVCGWTFHNPTPENIDRAKNELEQLLKEE